MLIVSPKFPGIDSNIAWQAGASNRADYILVANDGIFPPQKVKGIVLNVAALLGLDGEMAEIGRVLEDWMAVSQAEKSSWDAKRSTNAPIFDPSTWSSRLKPRAEVRVYDNAVDLVLGIMGYIRGRRKEAEEKSVGSRLLVNKNIHRLVVDACYRTKRALAEMGPKAPSIKGSYSLFHKMTDLASWEPSKLDTLHNICVLHDLSENCDNDRDWKSAWNADATGQKLDERGFKSKSTMRHNVGTVNEDTQWAARARFFDLPTWAGPSGTVETLCRFLDEVVKMPETQMLACVYALFGFWASDEYPKSATPIHHLYGVMTGARDYLPAERRWITEAGSVMNGLALFLTIIDTPSKL